VRLWKPNACGLLSGPGRAQGSNRCRRGKIQRAREGKVVPTHTPDYGFCYSEDRSTYAIVPNEMEVVRRIFDLISEGRAIRYVKRALESDNVPTPNGGKYWSVCTTGC
jgi:site-specific DNA recombinase